MFCRCSVWSEIFIYWFSEMKDDHCPGNDTRRLCSKHFR